MKNGYDLDHFLVSNLPKCNVDHKVNFSTSYWYFCLQNLNETIITQRECEILRQPIIQNWFVDFYSWFSISPKEFSTS